MPTPRLPHAATLHAATPSPALLATRALLATGTLLATGALLATGPSPASAAPAAGLAPAAWLATGAAHAPGAGSATTEDAPGTLRVMSRNLYLGADVGAALELIPDMPAAAQFMWEQVAETDFDQRVGILAQEAAAEQPDVIGLQEATTWACRPNPWSSPQTVFDFTQQFIEAAADAGVEYEVAEKDGARALNPGYEIPPIQFLTQVSDPATFQPLFGSDTADCGFTIGDALLVRADRAGDIEAVGTGEYDTRYAVAPVVFTIDRGYSWMDLAVDGRTVRVVTTHLESLWDAGKPVPSAEQARQLVADLSGTTAPLLVMGDFNSDPRDPRPAGAPNPGGQPEASGACPAQPEPVNPATADASCSAYWTMRAAGFTDAGPDALDPVNFTWGASGDLAGPDPTRLPQALAMGNDAGFTDRLDYLFLRNGAKALDARIIGNRWPESPQVWACDSPAQVRTTEDSSAILAGAGLAQPIAGRGVCLPTDHAGLVATIEVSSASAPSGAQPVPPDHSSLRIGLLGWLLIILAVLLVLLGLLVWGIVRLATRGRRRRAA